MNYKFKEVRLDLERDTIDVVVAFQVNRNQWQLKHYTFEAPEEVNIEELLERTKKIIFKEL